MKTKKRFVAVVLVAAMCLGLVQTAFAAESADGKDYAVSTVAADASDLTPEATNNSGYQNYYTHFATPICSYLTDVGNGYMRVEYTGSTVVVEYYDGSYNLTSKKYVDVELPVFGGFYAGSDAYYLLFGQDNDAMDDSVEVFRVVKYGKDWVRQGAASIYGALTLYPIHKGSPRMAECNGYLYVRTSHAMYVGHQANMMFEIDEETMEVTDSNYLVSNIKTGYVSHSFNQFIMVDDEQNLIAVDHGDGYPRAAVLIKYNTKAGNSTFSGGNENVNVFEFQGSVGTNNTGAEITGLEYSSSSYLVAGSSVTQDDNWAKHTAKNVFVTVSSRDDISDTTVKWITDYDTDGDISASAPQLVKLGDDSFLLLWTTEEYLYSSISYSNTTKLHYVYLDGKGNTTSEIFTVNGQLSDCKPIVSGNSVLWYVTGTCTGGTTSTSPNFYSVSADGKGTFSVKSEVDAPEITDISATWTGGIQVSWTEVPGADGYYVHENNSTYTVEGGDTTSTVLGSATEGILYIIWVEAYSGDQVSLVDDKQSITFLRGTSVSASIMDGGIVLSWTTVSYAKGYKIYRKVGDGEYELVCDTEEISWTDTDVYNGVEYTYEVYAYTGSSMGSASPKTITYYGDSPLLEDDGTDDGTGMDGTEGETGDTGDVEDVKGTDDVEDETGADDTDDVKGADDVEDEIGADDMDDVMDTDDADEIMPSNDGWDESEDVTEVPMGEESEDVTEVPMGDESEDVTEIPMGEESEEVTEVPMGEITDNTRAVREGHLATTKTTTTVQTGDDGMPALWFVMICAAGFALAASLLRKRV